jgi:hypothetical protein
MSVLARPGRNFPDRQTDRLAENAHNKTNVSHSVSFDANSDFHKVRCGGLQHLDASSHPLSAPNCVLNCEKLTLETYPTVHNDFASLMAFGICDTFQNRFSFKNTIFIPYEVGLFLTLGNLLSVRKGY